MDNGYRAITEDEPKSYASDTKPVVDHLSKAADLIMNEVGCDQVGYSQCVAAASKVFDACTSNQPELPDSSEVDKIGAEFTKFISHNFAAEAWGRDVRLFAMEKLCEAYNIQPEQTELQREIDMINAFAEQNGHEFLEEELEIIAKYVIENVRGK